MRFGGHAVDVLLFECYAGHEAVIAQLGKEPVVIPAAVPETHEAAVEGNQRDDGDVEQLLISFSPALGMQVAKQVRRAGWSRKAGRCSVRWFCSIGKNTMRAGASDVSLAMQGRNTSQPRSYAANSSGCTSTSLLIGS